MDSYSGWVRLGHANWDQPHPAHHAARFSIWVCFRSQTNFDWRCRPGFLLDGPSITEFRSHPGPPSWPLLVAAPTTREGPGSFRFDHTAGAISTSRDCSSLGVKCNTSVPYLKVENPYTIILYNPTTSLSSVFMGNRPSVSSFARFLRSPIGSVKANEVKLHMNSVSAVGGG